MSARRHFPIFWPTLFLIGSWFIGDFIGLFTHPGPLEVSALLAFGLAVGWRITVARDRLDLIQKLALVVVSLSVVLVLIEVWFVSQVLPITPEKRTKLIAKNASARSVAVERTPGTFRILGLADSFGIFGEEKNYHNLVKEELPREGAPPVELLNASVSGTAPGDHLSLYRSYAHYRPDLYLYGFYTGNDFDRPDGVLVQYRGVTWRHYFSWKELRPHHFMVRKWLFRLFEAWRKVGRISLKTGGPHADLASEELGAERGVFPYDVYLQIERSNFTTNFRRMDGLERRWGHTSQILDILKEEAERNGGRFVMVIHPDRVQVDKALRESLYDSFGLAEGDFDLEQPQRFLLGWCDSRGVPCLDLLPVFRASDEKGGLYLVNGIHYNSQGNALAARAITRWLLGEKIVPSGR